MKSTPPTTGSTHPEDVFIPNNTAKQQGSSRHDEYSPVLFNICAFRIHCHTVVREFMWASHCCIRNESILGWRFFSRVAPPLRSFVAIRDPSNEVKPTAMDALTIILLFFIYPEPLDPMSLQRYVFSEIQLFHFILFCFLCSECPIWPHKRIRHIFQTHDCLPSSSEKQTVGCSRISTTRRLTSNCCCLF